MFTLSIIGRLLLLPFKLLKLTIQYYTVGTVFTNDLANLKLQRILQAGIMQHMVNYLRLPFIHDHAMYKVSDLLEKSKSKLDPENLIPHYGEFYTKKDDSYPDSIWLTKTNKENSVLVYLHGGCFAMQLQDNQLDGITNIYKSLEKSGKSVSVLLVDYSLTSNGFTYPTQNNECAHVYDKLVRDGYTNISIMGDSAGGNLCLALLYRLSQKPAHSVVWPSAVILVSAMFDLTKGKFEGSLKENENVDVFSWQAINYFGNEYVANTRVFDNEVDVNVAANAEKFPWSTLPPIVKGNVLVLVGENEVLRDENLRWCDQAGLVKNYPDNIVIDPKGYHITFFVSESVAYGTLSEWEEQRLTKKILSFLKEKI